MTLRPGMRVSIVNSICVTHDAISTSIVESAHALEAQCPGSVRLYTYRCDMPGIASTVVPRVGALLNDEHFLASDALLFHFGIYYDLFDAFVLGNGRARRFARFHNVTPRELVPERMRGTIDRSIAQLENLAWADHVWCDSEYNRRFLVDYGLPEQKLSTLELPVNVPETLPAAPATGNGAPVMFLYLGRVVPAKGVGDLVRAVALMRRRGVDGFRVMIAGNASFSDSGFASSLAREVVDEGLQEFVTFCGEVSEPEKARLLESAHALVIPSYHEGFCMPVVEALGRGCAVVGYAAGNTPFIADGFGRLVAPGDIAALSTAMESVVRAMRSGGDPRVETDGLGALPHSVYRERAHRYASGFAPARFRERFVADFGARLAG